MSQRQLNTLIELCNRYRVTFAIRYGEHSFGEVEAVLSGDVTKVLRAIHENEAFKVIPDKERMLQLIATPEGLIIS